MKGGNMYALIVEGLAPLRERLQRPSKRCHRARDTASLVLRYGELNIAEHE